MIFLIWILKIVTSLLRLFGSGGTSLPGLLIENKFPKYLTRRARKYKAIILITGTNGKTTTQRLVHHLLESSGFKVMSNRSGANLMRGIASSFIMDSGIFGGARSDIAVLEVEEATMPILTNYIKPSLIVVTNLFRDQLDAYGEVLKTRSYILKAIKKCPKSKIVLNGDDDNVSSISNEVSNKVTLFKVDDKRTQSIFYERKYFSLKPRKSITEVIANKVKVQKDLSTIFNIEGFDQRFRSLHFSSPGIHYVYNAVAGIIAALSVREISPKDMITFFEKFNPAFGRGESVQYGSKKIRLILIKNPASFTANLNLLKNLLNLKLLIIINDNIADGTDVSWLWDAQLETLKRDSTTWITVSGNRAYDMALRLKYADIESRKVEIEENVNKALDIALSKLRDGETLFILPTYTAMLEVRKAIGGIVKIKEFWK